MPYRSLKWIAAAALSVGVSVVTPGIASGQARPAPDTAPVITMRLAYPDSANDRERARSGDSVVFLARQLLLSDADVAGVRSSYGRRSPLLLHIKCRPEASTRFRAALDSNVGGQLAAVINGRVATVAYIASAGSCENLTLGTPWTGEDAARIRELVRVKWPPQ
jgi:hypothetical protein